MHYAFRRSKNGFVDCFSYDFIVSLSDFAAAPTCHEFFIEGFTFVSIIRRGAFNEFACSELACAEFACAEFACAEFVEVSKYRSIEVS
jgi:hypothetical protein